MGLDNILNENIKLIEDYIENKLNFYKENILFEPIYYSIFAGGKRIRPILNIEAFKLFNNQYDIEDTLPLALLIEFIHNYSLVHDDLPAMDDDDYRRGKKSTHKKFGEAIGILTGDGLLNLGVEIVLREFKEKENLITRGVRAMYEIMNYSGIEGIIGGQVIDLELENRDTEIEEINIMYEKKTAALIQASLVSGAIMAGADNKEIELIRDFGLHLGLSYQLQDDLLDLEEDQKIGKKTIASILGLEKSQELSKKHLILSEDILDNLKDYDTSFFKDLNNTLIIRKY